MQHLYHTPVGVVHLGVVGQFHYQALQKVEDHHPTPDITNHTSNGDSTSIEAHHPTPNGNTGSKDDHLSGSQPVSREDQKESIEDEEAFIYQAQLRGLPYESCMQREDLRTSANSTLSVAPGEGQKPTGILTDEHFEDMCNPTK